MTAADLGPGTQVGAYRVVELISSDDTSETYRAVRLELDRPVALTVLRGSAAADPDVARRIVGDVAGLRGLDHPAILAVDDAGVHQDRPYLATPLIRGRTLEQLIAERGPLVDDVLGILRPVADALDHAHSRGVIHRAITPAAVLVDDDGRALLTFTSITGPEPDTSTTATGTDLTSPLYLAPEQAASAVISHRADLYSFGCVAFETLTGSAPYTVPGMVPLLLAHTTGPIPRPSSRNAELPAAVDDVFTRALAKAPTERYPSARGMVDALQAAFQSPTAHRRPLYRSTRQLTWTVGMAAALTATAVVTVALTGTDSPTIPPGATATLIGEPIAVGSMPSDVEAGEGFVWTTNAGTDTISRIDPQTGSSTEIRVGGKPVQLVVGQGAAWVRNFDDAITRVDAVTRAVSEPIPAGGRISGMAIGGGQVWLSHVADDTVTRIDIADLALVGEPIAVGSRPKGMEFGANLLYVLNTGDSTMSRIDPASGLVVGSAVTLPEGLGGLEVADGVVYVAAAGDVAPVPESSCTVGPPFRLGGFSYFEVAGGFMWVVYNQEDVVRRLDVTTRKVQGEPVADLGRDVGRARFAFGALWLTVPTQNSVVRLAPVAS
ncbi:MAG: protein kinase domain-containing protein [Pseudonocardia sp.]